MNAHAVPMALRRSLIGSVLCPYMKPDAKGSWAQVKAEILKTALHEVFHSRKGGRSQLPSWSALAEGLLLPVLLQPAPKPVGTHEGGGFKHLQADESLKVLIFSKHFCH